ncbi:MAG: carboxypeptidase-like regulatory domain-containing protein [Sphingobacteriales bacterium]|nr:carboxypeptidase-like regulatory domain-containing protein [Sphingobacteriales bacterium]
MRFLLRLLAIMAVIQLLPYAATAQQTIKGVVKNGETNDPIQSVSVQITGTDRGTSSKSNGEFELNVTQLPVRITFSSIGFEAQEITFSDGNSKTILLKPFTELGQEVVVSASRTAERMLNSAVTVERVSSAAIRNTPAVGYYDIISNIKGVNVVNSSLTFTSPTTRGFAGSGNTRFNQIVDGIDNQAPALNFAVGSVVGLSELDVESMELLPGASSALYGSGGMNGTLLINSKTLYITWTISAN